LNPGSGHRLRDRSPVVLGAVLALALAGSGCGGDEPRSAAPSSEAGPASRGAPAPLGKLRSQANALLDGGPAAFRRQIEALEGYPIVVNKWASWCGPCRLEFPFFQRLARKHAKRVAFLGVDSLDSKEQAKEFLERFPVPYPSFFDSKGKVAAVFRGHRVFPASAFYDSEGELVFTKQGPYDTQAALAKDIRRYAR
jgi:cytochrome c biogenesis protein CcmG/thiol:disulfide interchange protein DsbE